MPVDQSTPQSIVKRSTRRYPSPKARNCLASMKEKKLHNAIASYAVGMKKNEVPLFFHDNSFLQNGKSGMLVTDRAIYSSNTPIRIPLSIVQTSDSEFGLGEEGKGLGGIRVNGLLVYKDRFAPQWQVYSIQQLGKFNRKHKIEWPISEKFKAVINEMNRGDFTTLGIAKLRQKMPTQQMAAELMQSGMSTQAADAMSRQLPLFAKKGNIASRAFLISGLLCLWFFVVALIFLLGGRGKMIWSPSFFFLIATATQAWGLVKAMLGPSDAMIQQQWHDYCSSYKEFKTLKQAQQEKHRAKKAQ